jgi:hypothetical protein
MPAFSRFEKRGCPVTEFGIHISTLVERSRDCGQVAFAGGFPHLIVQVLFRILRNYSQRGEQCEQKKA